MLPRVAGSGCLLSAMVAAFTGTTGSLLEASVAAGAVLSLAAEAAAKVAKGPGSFQVELLDAIGNFCREDLEKFSFEVLAV